MPGRTHEPCCSAAILRMNKGGREQTGWKGNRQDGVRKLEVGDRPGLDAGLGSGGKSGGILWNPLGQVKVEGGSPASPCSQQTCHGFRMKR